MATTAPPPRWILGLLVLLAAATLLGVGPWPGLPTDWPHGLHPNQVLRIRVAAVLGGLAVLAATWSLRSGQRGAAFEWTAVAMPLLAIRSKWTLLLGAACLAAQISDGASPTNPAPEDATPARLHLLAGAAAATTGWLFLLSGEAVLRAAPRYLTGLAPLPWVALNSGLGLLGIAGLLLAFLQGLRTLYAWRQPPDGRAWLSLVLLEAAVLLLFLG